MNQTSETTPIADFILQSERNLRVALAVFAKWETTKDTLATGFCRRLEAQLKKKLPEWKFAADCGLLTYSSAAFAFSKPKWEEQYYIQLQADDYGKKMSYGVCRAEKLHGKRPPSPELLEAIRKQLPSAHPNKWFEAQIKLQSPAADWSTAEVLWQIHTKDEFLRDVAAQLLELAKLSEKIVDSLVAKYGGKKKPGS